MGLLYGYQKVDSPPAPIKTDYYKPNVKLHLSIMGFKLFGIVWTFCSFEPPQYLELESMLKDLTGCLHFDNNIPCW